MQHIFWNLFFSRNHLKLFLLHLYATLWIQVDEVSIILTGIYFFFLSITIFFYAWGLFLQWNWVSSSKRLSIFCCHLPKYSYNEIEYLLASVRLSSVVVHPSYLKGRGTCKDTLTLKLVDSGIMSRGSELEMSLPFVMRSISSYTFLLGFVLDTHLAQAQYLFNHLLLSLTCYWL